MKINTYVLHCSLFGDPLTLRWMVGDHASDSELGNQLIGVCT